MSHKIGGQGSTPETNRIALRVMIDLHSIFSAATSIADPETSVRGLTNMK